MIQGICSNLEVLMNPVSNSDSRDKVVEWFYRYLKGKTDRASLPRMSPPYWSKVCFRGHLSRHAPANARDYQRRPSHVSRMASHRGARSSRRVAVYDDLEWHRPF
jgi:hypothetical protein